MLRPRWRKVLRDLWYQKARTLIVVLSIAVGVFAVGLIVSSQIMLSEDLSAAYAATHPASAILYTDAFDQELVEVVRRVDGVRDAEGRRNVTVRLKVSSGASGESVEGWRTLSLDAVYDYEDIRLDQIAPVSGAWPPPTHELLIERSSLGLTGAEVGDMLLIETPDGKQRELRIAGLAYDLNKPPAQFVGTPYGYVTLDTLEWLGFSRSFSEMHIQVAERSAEADTEPIVLWKGHVQAVAEQVEDKIEKSGRTVYWTYVPEPGEHPANEVIQPLLLILGVLGMLSLFLSAFLVVNIISALMAQQVRQIGIMKAVGARSPQIVRMYLGAVLVFGALSLLVAVPLGGAAAYLFSSFMASLINFDLNGFRLPLQALALEVAVGLLVPLLAALYPVLAGARVTVREAISSYGLGKGLFGRSLLDRAVETATTAMRVLSRPMRLSLRNTFRRKGRLTLTLLTLTLGGAIFIAVLSVQAPLMGTFDEALAYWNEDVQVNFGRTYRTQEIQEAVREVPGVAYAESWLANTARRVRPDGHEGPNFSLIAPPAETELIQPTLLEGRWLLPKDENALVLNTNVLSEEPDVQVGDEVILKIEGRETSWRVVGIVKGVMTGPIGYANQPYFARVVRFVGRASTVHVIAERPEGVARHDPAFETELANRLTDYLDGRGLQVSSTTTLASIRETVRYQFNIIVVFLAVMAILIAVVGGLGLMGTMSINVIERTREIGVIRAIGASDGSVLKIFMVEGLMIGLLSWTIGAALALPIGKLMSDMVGIAFTDSPLSYTFSTPGLLVWLGIVLTLATLASFLPAWNAARLTVREVLAYE
jgi:putative ABC transport system permease protein